MFSTLVSCVPRRGYRGAASVAAAGSRSLRWSICRAPASGLGVRYWKRRLSAQKLVAKEGRRASAVLTMSLNETAVDYSPRSGRPGLVIAIRLELRAPLRRCRPRGRSHGGKRYPRALQKFGFRLLGTDIDDFGETTRSGFPHSSGDQKGLQEARRNSSSTSTFRVFGPPSLPWKIQRERKIGS